MAATPLYGPGDTTVLSSGSERETVYFAEGLARAMRCCACRVETCARRRMVSRGNLMKRSAVEARKEKMLYVVGEVMGSMWNWLRSRRGVEEVRIVGRVEWRTVIGMRDVGTKREGRERRSCRVARGGRVVGVMINLRRLSA